MNWSDERYVRVYTRDTADLLAVGWEGRLVLYELLRKCDRAGVLATGGDLAIIPELLRIPVDIFERGIERLAKRGTVVLNETSITVPNYLAAQEAKYTTAARQRESRQSRAERASANGEDPRLAARPDRYGASTEPRVTERDPIGSQNVTNGSHGVTAGHSGSQRVTLGHSVPYRTVLSRTQDPEEACRAEAPDVPPVKAIRNRGALKGPAADDTKLYLEWFNRRMGRQFEVREPVVRMVARLLAAGHSQGELRMVALGAKELWEHDPKMAKYLQPSTLLAFEKFGERLDAAKAAHPEWVERAARGGFANGSSMPTVPEAGADERGRDREDGDVQRPPSAPRLAAAHGVRCGGMPALFPAHTGRAGGEGQS